MPAQLATADEFITQLRLTIVDDLDDADDGVASTLAPSVRSDLLSAASRVIGSAPSLARNAQADLGPLDGPTGSLRGDRFDPATVGLRTSATLGTIARVLIHGTDAPGACAMPGCDADEHRAKARWCASHEPQPGHKPAGGTCTVDGCPAGCTSGPWCRNHHSNWFKTGNPLGASAGRGRCHVPACDGDWARRGLCDGHLCDQQDRSARRRAIPTRTRRRLRRHAVVSAMVAPTPREILRASVRWVKAVAAAAADIPAGTPEAARAANEVNEALEAMFGVGAGKLANREAQRWVHPGAKTEFWDLMQAAYEGAMRSLDRYDPDAAPFSSFAYFAMNDLVSQEVHSTEHPDLPRAAFKRRGQIMRLAQQLEEAGYRSDSPETWDVIASKLDGTTASIVGKVLDPAVHVSSNMPVGGNGFSDGEHSELGDLLADDGPAVVDGIVFNETVAAVGRQMHRLDPTERDIILRYEGIGDAEPEDLSAIGDSYERSRTWAGSCRKKGLARLQHPISLSDIAGAETNPSMLGTSPSVPFGTSWLDALSERARFVAGNVLGLGQAPLPGPVAGRVRRVADAMRLTDAEIHHLMFEVLDADPAGAGLPEAKVGQARRAAAAALVQIARRAEESARGAEAAAARVRAALDEVDAVPAGARDAEWRALHKQVGRVERVADAARRNAQRHARAAAAALTAARSGKVCPRDAARTAATAEAECNDQLHRIIATADATEARVAEVRADLLKLTRVPTPDTGVAYGSAAA